MTLPVDALALAWGWVGARRARFGLHGRRTVGDEIKTIGELALAAELQRRAAHGDGDEATRLLDHGWEALAQGATIAARIEADPAEAVLGLCYVPFHRSGLRSPRVLDALARVDAAAVPDDRRLFVAAAHHLLQIDGDLDFAALVQARFTQALGPPWNARDRDLYLITHVIYYVTHDGLAPRGGSDELRAHVELWLPAWTEHVRRGRNLDLLGELMLAHHVLGMASPAPTWERLVAGQRDNGSIPDLLPGHRASDDEEFDRDHHPTLVFLMAGATAPPAAAGRP